MAESSINDTCIVGLPACGYGFQSARMAFIAAPSDSDSQLEIDILKDVLRDRTYEAFVAVDNFEPAKLVFCEKICSKIIQSHFCIALLNPSKHRENLTISIPNPNVYFEYGLMLAFKKRVIPLQLSGPSLPFNISGLDTILYDKSNFKNRAETRKYVLEETFCLTYGFVKYKVNHKQSLNHTQVQSHERGR